MDTPYRHSATELSKRIADLIPDNPQILDRENFRAGDLFGVKGLYCDDLRPSLVQASLALEAARSSSARCA